MSGLGRFGLAAWDDLGGDPALTEHVRPLDPSASLASRLDVVGLAADSVALAGLAVQEVARARDMVDDMPPVTVRGDRLCTSIRSERCFRLDGRPMDAWAPLSGFFATADGWVRTHGNYPHHARRLRELLGLPDDADADDVATALAARGADEIEEHAARTGAIAVRVRHADEWERHPHAQATRGRPLVEFRHLGPHGARRLGRAARGVPPLAGVRVLDLTRVIAGPVATRDLAFAGADVLRIDSPRLPEIPWQHLDTGQGKRSTLLDLARPADRLRFDDLLGEADVVVTGYRPGALARLGLHADELAERRPGIVVAQISAWGATGPWAGRRGFDSIVQAATGIAMVESDDGERPGALPAQALDHSAGHLLAAGIAHALAVREATGRGAEVSVALARVATALLAGGRGDRRADAPGAATTQTRATEGRELVTAAPVLAYAGAPDGYPEMGGVWGADAPEWRVPETR